MLGHPPNAAVTTRKHAGTLSIHLSRCGFLEHSIEMNPMRAITFVVVAVISLCAGECVSAVHQPMYQVGAAKVDITPRMPVLLSGYAARGMVEIGRVEQQLWARAIAIGSDEEGPAVLISVDNCGVPLAVRQKVAEALKVNGVSNDRLIVSSTHTHSAPMLTGVLANLFSADIPVPMQERVDGYTAKLSRKMIEAARLALQNRQTARLSYGVGKVGFANNRRTPGGPTDHDVPVLRAVDDEGNVRAIVLGYACHCTALAAVPFISGDWAGYSSEYLEAEFDDAVALTIIGCGADQNPQPRHELQHAQQHGRMMAEEVTRLLRSQLKPLSGKLESTYREITIDFDRIPERDEWEDRAKLKGITGHHARKILATWERVGQPPAQIPYPVQTLRLGDELAMVFLADEVVVDYSLRLKRELDSERLWVSAYCNDATCYIPSERVLQEGGYEGGGAMVWYGWPGPFAPGLEAKIVAEVHRQIPDTFNAEGYSAYFQQSLQKIDANRTGGSLPRSPSAALASLRTHDDLRVELAAAEPLVIDPVAIDWAPDGSLWVAEMFDYPMGLDGNYKPGGRVKRLSDTDGDGEYDRSTVFLDGLPFPTGVTTWGNGVLICAAPDVIYAEDTDGDGRADVRKTWLTGFVTHNYQARVNSLSFGLDNWLYAAAGIFGGVISTPDGTSVDVSNRDFRFDVDKGRLEPVSGRTQQGRARDDFGNWFGCSNSNLLTYYPTTERYFRRNPLVAPPPQQISLGVVDLFPPDGIVTFELTGPPGRPTAACGLGIYRDTLLGEEYAGNTFTCEPVNQLVHRRVLQPKQVTFNSARAESEQQQEFLTSNDKWFRPVQVRTGPDGALYVVDMCRYVIEHPRWIPPAARNHLDLRAGDSMGRIYRIVPKSDLRRTVSNLTQLDTPALAAALDTSNGTLRDLVQHLLVRRRDRVAATTLEGLVLQSEHAATRVQALYTLNGLGILQNDLLEKALTDRHIQVRRHAIVLAETRLNDAEPLQQALLALVKDRDPRIQLQLAYSLGEWDSLAAAHALAEIALANGADPYIRAAVMTSVDGAKLPMMLARVLGNGNGVAAADELGSQLLDLAIRDGQEVSFDQLIAQIMPDEKAALTAWHLDALAGIVRAIHRRTQEVSAGSLKQIRAAEKWALRLVGEDAAPLEERVAAVELITATWNERSDADRLTMLGTLLAPQQPLELQTAAIQALSGRRTKHSHELLLGAWASLGPKPRTALLDGLMSSQSGTDALLAALEERIVQPGQLDTTRRDQLLSHSDSSRRERAAKILSGATTADRRQVIAAYREASDQGDAARGKQAFVRYCAVCHQLEGVGHAVGPDLAALTVKTKEGLLTAILDPSRDVDQRYTGYTALTTDGKTVTGILVAESSNSVTLKAQENKTTTVLRADLEALKSTGKSIMPDGFERNVSPGEMADLIAYLGGSSGVAYRYAGGSGAHPSYPDGAVRQKLTDGKIGAGQFNDGHWLGFHRSTAVSRPSVIFDFGRPTDVKSVQIIYGVNHTPGGIHAPDRVTVSFSDNGVEFNDDKTFTPFDDSPDGLGTFQIDRRRAQFSPHGRMARFARLDFENDGEWTFLTEVAFNVPLSMSAAEAKESAAEARHASAEQTARRITALVAEVEVGTADEYRKIPDIWRQAIATGKRNQEAELMAVLKRSLPEKSGPLRDWQAVVIGGGIINGLTQAGVWPAARIEKLIGGDEELETRWRHSLQAAVRMADDEQVKSGTRYDALRMVALLPWNECGPQLAKYARKGVNAELQQGAVSGLGDVPDKRAAAMLISALPGLTAGNQKFAAEALVRSNERIDALLTAVEQKKLSASLIPASVKKLLREIEDRNVNERAQRLLP